MANSIDLNFDAKRAFGEYFPTVYLDFVEVSYGMEKIEGTEEERYSYSNTTGTHLNGSFSVYFTREATESQSKEDLATWLINNLDELYLYSWISGWKSINEKVKKSSLDLRELFYSMEPATAADFDSDHPAFGLIIAEMKNAFFTGTQGEETTYRTTSQKTWDASTGAWIVTEATPDLSTMMATIDIPGSWAYKRFWGNPGTTGPWPRKTADDVYDIDGSEVVSYNEMFAAGIGFMERYLAWTLASYQTHGGGYSVVTGQKFSAIRLLDLIPRDGSNIKVEGTYDSDGDEIGVIVNLPIGGIDGFMLSQDIIEKRFDDGEVYLIATIGRKVLSEIGWDASSDSVGALTDEFREMNSTLFNSNFGDITYEHILTGEGSDTNNMAIATKPEEIFVSVASGSPVDGKPIMSIDGTYHDSNPMNQQIVVNTMNQILNKYGEYIDKSLSMKKNLSNLAYILGDKGENIDLLRRLQTYRKTYMGKSAGTSGKMYEAFKKLLHRADQEVKKQSKLKKILVVNNKIIDLRLSATNVSYVEGHHNGTGNCTGDAAPGLPGASSALETPDSGKYIPEAWAHMSRRTIKTVPIEGRNLLSELSQYIFEEGTPTYTYEDTGVTAYASTVEYLGATEESRSEWIDYYENFTRDRAVGQPAAMLHKASTAGGTDTDRTRFGFGDGVTGTGEGTYIAPWVEDYQDTVVENKGIFFFDYEKALQTQSKLSYVILPKRIERYLGLHVPYNYFRVKEVRLVREELKFKTSMTEDEAVELDESLGDTITITQRLVFDDDKNYPIGKYTEYSGYIDTDGDTNYRYGQPSVMLASSVTPGTVATGGFELFGSYTELTDTAGKYAGSGAAALEHTGFYGDYSDASVRGATLDGAAGSFVQEGAANFTYEISAESVVPEYSYLKFVNFDAPLGMRDNGDPHTYYSSPTRGTGHSTGQLQSFRSSHTRRGYRVMAFEYRDYMDDDVAYYNTVGREEFFYRHSDGPDGVYGEERAGGEPTKYRIEIDVEDTSLKMIDDIYYHLEENYNKFIRNYYNLAVATCSFNNINDQFNEFFANGIKEKYPSYEDQEWIRAPYIFNMARNVLFNTFGEDEDGEIEATSIQENTARTARLIGPDDGRLMHLNTFKTDFEKLINVIRPHVGSPTTATNGQRLFGSSEALHPGGDGFTGPVYTYHPVYDRTLIVAGMGEDVDNAESWSTDYAVDTAWSSAINHADTYTFKNSTDGGETHGWPIEEQIYGDIFLSAIHEWDYTPEDVSISYEEMFEFIKLIPGLLEQSYMDEGGLGVASDGYRGLFEPPSNLLEYGATAMVFGGLGERWGYLQYPPLHRNEERSMSTGIPAWMTQEIWNAWIYQLIFFAFVNKYHRVLENGIGLAPYHISDRSWSEIQEFIETMLDASGEDTAAYGAGFTSLHMGIAYANSFPEHGDNHSRLIKNRDNIWTPKGIEAIATIMNPRIYYTVQTHSGFMPDFHRPYIEYTHMGFNLDGSGKFSISTHKQSEYTTAGSGHPGEICVYTSGDDAYANTDGYSTYDSSIGAIGFVTSPHLAREVGISTGRIHVYPGAFTPVQVGTLTFG